MEKEKVHEKNKTIFCEFIIGSNVINRNSGLCSSMCAIYGVDATLISNGEHLWTNHQSHTATYSENGVLKNEKCYITISEDKYTWTCPNGHGIVTTRVRHRESHTCKHCESLDYFK